MKIKENDSNLTRQVKKKKKGNFEVRIPRIIVRNLDFKVKEDLLKKTFEKCGAAVSNVSIVSRGFGFVTFDKLEDAQQAVQAMNGQKILGRPMAVDWSLPKNVYEKMQTKGMLYVYQTLTTRVHCSKAKGLILEDTSPVVRHDGYGIQSSSTLPEKMGEEEKEAEDDEDDEGEDPIEDEETLKTRKNESSRDVREHRTLFVRNVPFSATEEDLSNILSSNGQRRIVSCLLVIDRISKHPRGSAFVQFGSSSEAEECLNTSFTLSGQELQIDLALGRGELVKARELRDNKQENTKKHDQRNLSLAKYGVILNLAELDGNENDLRKRQNLEDVKKQKLKDLAFFISPTRLTIHNLPTHIDDEKLRKLIVDTLKNDHVPMKDIILNECRVMKQNKDAKKSLGFGFINLPRHDLALRIIELLDNNKHVFGSNRRPIVQFSIENRHALQIKEQRHERLHAKRQLFLQDKNVCF